MEIEFANDADSAVKRLGEEIANFDKVICDGLSGGWEKVHKAAQERGLSMLLWITNDDFLDIATERGIPNLHKGASLRELHNALFPPLGSVEAK